MWRRGELQMLPPTVASLEWLTGFGTSAASIAAATRIGVPPVIQPRLVLDATGRITGIKRPGDIGYDEVADPEFVVGKPR
jgi:hypothetical protein